MKHQEPAMAVLTTTDRFPPALQRLCGTAVRVLHEHARIRGVCVVCGVSWPCERTRLADNNLALL